MRTIGNSVRTAACLILFMAFGLLAAPVTASGSPPQDGQNPHGTVWDEWQPLAQGYIARRRMPARMHLPAEERRSPATQERAQSGRDNRPWEQLSLWFHTDAPGLYGISLDELAAETGIGVGQLRGAARSGRMSLINGGDGVSWYFDARADRLVWAGERYETSYAERNAYRLRQTQTPDPQRIGNRLSVSRRPVAGQPTPFRERLHFEEESDLLLMLWLDPSNPDSRYWFWDYLYGSVRPSIEIPLHIPDPAGHGPARIRIRLHGFTNLYPGNDHRVRAELNGYPVGGVLEWDGLTPAELTAEFDQGLLNGDGANTLVLYSLFDAGRPFPGQLLESIEIAYMRLPVAEEGQLWLRRASGGAQEVSGFSSPEIYVVESPVRGAVLRGDAFVYPSGSGWAVAFDARQGADYLVAEAPALRAPIIDAREQADLAAPGNGADYLIIAPREFSKTADALAEHRQARHGQVAVVWLDDIYKEFSFGRVDPFAVGRFMDHVQLNWALSPSTVTLVGKGSLDRKDRMGYGDNFLPVLMTSSPWQLAPSDVRLLGSPDGVAPFAYGRLPITSDAEGLAYVAKLQEHEWRSGGSADRRAVVVADNPDSGGDFHSDANGLASQLQGLHFTSVTKLYHPTHAVRSRLITSETWDTGFVSYSGHGTSQRLGNLRENFLNADDAGSLRNKALPVFAAMTCSAGLDVFPGTRSLAAALVLNPQGGAIASLAPGGLSSNVDAHVLGAAFVDHLYQRQSSVGGALAGAAFQTRGEISGFMAPMYTVIGDPGVRPR